MTRTKLITAGVLALAISFAGVRALAQEPVNQITYFTFSAPFELPGGKVLPAGKYVFKIADSPSNRHVVHIMSEDQKTMHATLLAIPAQRMEPADEPEVRFMETAANTPPAVRTWWYPGRSIGHEFIYPREHARRLASRQKESVLTVASDATTTDQMQTADLARVNPSGQESAVAESTTAETQPSAERAAPPAEPTRPQATAQADRTPEQPTPTPAPTPAPRTADTPRTELPRTASPLPLIGLLGLGSLLGAGAIRLRRR
jgi:hypothetical protein